MPLPGAPPPILSEGSTRRTGPRPAKAAAWSSAASGVISGTRPCALSAIARRCQPVERGLGRLVVAGRHHRERHARIGHVGEGEAGDDIDRPDLRVGGFDLPRQRFEVAHRQVGGAGSGRRPDDRHASPEHPRALAGCEAAREEFGRAHGGVAGIDMRVLAIADQPVREPRHRFGQVGVEVEDAEQRNLLQAGHRAEPAEDLAFDVVERFAHHGAVERQVDRVDTVPRRALRAGHKIGEEGVDDRVLDAAGRASPCRSRRGQFPSPRDRRPRENRRSATRRRAGRGARRPARP